MGPEYLVPAAVAAVFLFGIGFWFWTQILVICTPSELVIISGRRHRMPDGTVTGYKVLIGGRGFRIPILEGINRMDMRLIPVVVEVNNAFSKGGIPLKVQAIANVKISSDPALIRNAIERFMSMSNAAIGQVAQQTLEGVLREVISELTPEEVNEDRLKFAEALMKNAKDDLDKLGLSLDVLKIQTVTDDQGYLNNLGRGAIAEMIRDARNAENQAKQAIAEAQASARERAESAKKRAEALVATRKNNVRAEVAAFEAQALAVENEAAIAAETARAQSEQVLQTLRADLEGFRLEVDIALPAEAGRLAAEAGARAAAAPLVENGKAQAEALRMVAAEWQEARGDGRDLYVLQHLSEFITTAVARVEAARVDEIAVVDGANGDAYAGVVASFPSAVAQVMHETGRAVGVDLQGLLGAPRTESNSRSAGSK